ncbi:bifunctional demethylmenaquinone methyltransferase/2-methoxy-6-polyprenyl-1,4-benzoquinol methylase UbiE [Candidatus Poribacteria bacterium]|nr:bifunctional demethylmenaquinone methyltransferase/2-methoxy-6-polyprenyl-1,4-benzoquinol methylase UbiE [Candidatus Poribacteria bacterium]MXV84584.1 bifunctional demethylmenaquinone methyltransferase/2-methoxy-6-polyprenyl-1,4-benzoquinol methylase UbiE [Candidatus Poribacteria bacterium]MYA55272.1 bifunctional demethylmenaquinone methyltransferase/2-methoxy-6-polyprenyl-1,4-benzoquinol methylase UbiE [Candidatus Poribacteria bacterium]
MSEKRIQNLFAAVAYHYDFLNSLLSLRRDRAWRRETVKASGVDLRSKVLDVCTGTGELALAYADKIGAEGFVIASDFCFEMLVIGDEKVERKERGTGTSFLAADTLILPFLDDTFDVVSVGFGIRNVSDLEMGIREMARVAAPGGRVVILEFTQPVNPLFRSLYYFYFTKILPFVGNLISRSQDDAYGYLPRSVMKFPNCEALKAVMEQCGLTDVRFYRKTFGIVSIHVGQKPDNCLT